MCEGGARHARAAAYAVLPTRLTGSSTAMSAELCTASQDASRQSKVSAPILSMDKIELARARNGAQMRVTFFVC